MDERENSEPQERRPPLYNPEDYVTGLKKFSKLTGLQLYLGEMDLGNNNMNNNKSETKLNCPTQNTININNNNMSNNNNRKNKKNRSRSSLEDEPSSSTLHHDSNKEMELRQFGTITELLAKLRSDLQLAFPSFVREFIGVPNDGVTWLLDALKSVQLAQTNITGSLNQLGSRANHFMFKRALNDEFSALLCLKMCSKSEEGALKLVEHPSGLFTVAVCVMSNFSKSRILSLQLLSRLCDLSNGHKQVSDALSMLRLRFGEPVRFKFLVGMLNSYNSDIFQVSCLRFLNRFVETAKDARERIMIQTELEEAGFELLAMKKRLLMTNNSTSGTSTPDDARLEQLLQEEIQRWTHNYIDVNGLVRKLLNAERANKKLREEISELLTEKARQSNKSKADSFAGNASCGCCSCEDDEAVFEKPDNNTTTTAALKSPTKHIDKFNNIDSKTTFSTSDNSILTFYDEVNFDVEIEEEEGGNDEQQQQQQEQQHCSLVTVLASDGYTCVTSPLIGSNSSNSNSSTASIRIVAPDHFGADSGLSSDSSDPSPRRANSSSSSSTSSSNRDDFVRNENFVRTDDFVRTETHFRTYRSDEHSDKSDKSSYSEKHDKEASKETLTHSDIYDFDENDATYVERNVLQEEATTLQTETISVEKLRQRYDSDRQEQRRSSNPRPASRQKSSSSSNHSHSNSQNEKPLPAPRSKSPVVSHVEETINRFQEISLKSPRISRFASRDELDACIIPRRTPRPPARRRPKSTPITHPLNSQLTQLMAEKKREMVYLPDMSDGETSDGGVSTDYIISEEDQLCSNTNTLETMSARSFGFVRPSTQIRQKDLAKRLRRHQSFLEPSTETLTKTPPTKPVRHSAVRRSESFHHNHDMMMSNAEETRNSSAIFRFAISRPSSEQSRARGKSVERMLDDKPETEASKLRPLHKSKSMEFLKAKLLSRKGTQKLPPQQVQQPPQQPNSRVSSRSQSPSVNVNSHTQHWSNSEQMRGKMTAQQQRDYYDWRQDTPFWNQRGRWSRPAPLGPKPRPSGHNGTNGTASLNPFQKMLHSNFPPNPVSNNTPLAPWPGRQYPGMFMGNTNFYPRPFAIANPQNPKNVSHNIFMPPPPQMSPQHRFGGHHPSFAAAVAQAAAAAASQAAQAAQHAHIRLPEDDLPSRLEITELSDGDGEDEGEIIHHLPVIPSPDYSTMRSSPAESINTVIHMGSNTISKGKGHILDIPSGLY